MEKIIFKADRLSGIEGCVFGVSFFLECVRMSDYRHIFKFPFYALTLKVDEDRLNEWIDNEKYGVVCDEIVEYVRKNGFSYFRNVEKTAEMETKEFLEYAWRVNRAVSKMKDKELAKNFYDFICEYFYCYGIGCITFLYEHTLSQRLSDSLATKCDNVADAVSILLKTKYKSFMAESEDLLFKIAMASGAQKKKLINSYLKRYFSIDTSYHTKIELNEKIVFKKAEVLLAHGAKKNNAVAKPVNLKLSGEEGIIVELLKSAEMVRDKRKQLAMAGTHVILKFLDEAVRRRKLKLNDAKKAHWFEFRDLLDFPKKTLERAKKRDCMTIVLNGNSFQYLDYIAVESRSAVEKKVKIFKGTPAAAGKYQGRVKIIVAKKDFPKMKKGDILVTDMTRPDYLPIMRLAGAIITDEGGLTCHAAVISRELGIPCVVGTRVGTRVLKDGDIVEVSAERGVIKIIKN